MKRMKTKVCAKCLIKKPIYHFNRRAEAVDGHVTSCRQCQMKSRRDVYRKTEVARDVTRVTSNLASFPITNFNRRG